MRIWLLTQYYFPEVGAAAIRLSRLARALVADGHELTVLTALPNYPEGVISTGYRSRLYCRERIDDVDVRRVWLFTSPRKSSLFRVITQLSFALSVALRATFLPRPDVIFVESHPLFVCLAGGWLKRVKQAPVVLNVSDLWPESAVAVGALSPDSTLVKLATLIERWAYRDAAHVVGLTQGIVDGIAPYNPRRLTLIRNAVDLTRFCPADPEARQSAKEIFGFANRFVAAHVGNMSLTYDFDLLLDAARQLPDVLFVFVGTGSQYEAVHDKAADLKNVRFLGKLPHHMMPQLWAASDACLISLRDHSVAGGTLPAKMFEALATGTPIVAAIRGEGSSMLLEAQAGFAVPIADVTAMVSALKSLQSDPLRRAAMSASARHYAEAHLQTSKATQAYSAILSEVV